MCLCVYYTLQVQLSLHKHCCSGPGVQLTGVVLLTRGRHCSLTLCSAVESSGKVVASSGVKQNQPNCTISHDCSSAYIPLVPVIHALTLIEIKGNNTNLCYQ
jgi:hypothetical protein